MRACCAILILVPLALGASGKSAERGARGAESNTAASAWAPAPFSRYEGILERKPFGLPPPPSAAATAAAAAAAVPPPPSFAAKITLCALNRMPSGSVAVGFVDANVTPPHNYYLAIGEREEGFTVLNADVDLEFAVIDKDGISETFWLAGANRRMLPTLEPAAMTTADGQPKKPAELEPPSRAKPMFTNALEQLLSMELSVPAGIQSPPLPITGDLQNETRRALSSTIVIETNDTDAAAAHKETVGLAKEELRAHMQDGGTPTSYLQTLKERRDAEIARQTAAREAAEAQIRELARKLSQDELDKHLDAINQKLNESGVAPIDAPDAEAMQ